MSTSISKHLQNEYNFDAWVITCEVDDDDMPHNEKNLCEKYAIKYVKFRGFDVKRDSNGFSFQVVDRNSTTIEDAIFHHISNDTGLYPKLFLHAWKTRKILSNISEPSETSSEASVNMSVASTSTEIYFPQKRFHPNLKSLLSAEIAVNCIRMLSKTTSRMCNGPLSWKIVRERCWICNNIFESLTNVLNVKRITNRYNPFTITRYLVDATRNEHAPKRHCNIIS